ASAEIANVTLDGKDRRIQAAENLLNSSRLPSICFDGAQAMSIDMVDRFRPDLGFFQGGTHGTGQPVARFLGVEGGSKTGNLCIDPCAAFASMLQLFDH